MEDQPDSKEPKKGSARERQRRRMERRARQGQVSGGGQGRQLAPAGGFKLPEFNIDLPIRTLLYGIAGVAFVIAVIVGLGLFKNTGGAGLPPNAVWLGTEWTYESRPDNEIQALADRFRDNRIGTVYAWVSWLQADQTWRGVENFGTVQRFVEQFKQAYPEARLYAWLGVPANLDEDNYRLDDLRLQQNIAEFSQTSIDQFGFDGLFLNVEPVWDGDENFLEMLRNVRSVVGDDIPISVAIPPDWSPTDADIPVPPLIEPGTIWERAYKQRVALLSDQMAVMAYNSGLSSPDDYEIWMAYQVQTFAEAVADLDTGTELVIGIPTYDAELPAHDPVVENIDSAVNGIREGLVGAGEAADFVQGVALYAEWETDDGEWSQFNSLWVNR